MTDRHISIAIATWNRAALLRRVLEHLSAVCTPAGWSWSVSVCDNNSRDDTPAAVEQSARLFERSGENIELRYLHEPTQGKSHALNRLLGAVDSGWVLFLDDDVKADAGLLEAYARGVERYPRAACFGGPAEAWVDGPLPAGAQRLIEWYPAIWGLVRLREDVRMSPPEVSAFGANMLLRRDAIPRGGFAVERGMIAGRRVAGEDVGMVQAVLAAGHEGYLLADAKVGHSIPPGDAGVRRFCRWQVGFGRHWRVTRGAPAVGRFGVAWWAWKELARRAIVAGATWRPWPSKKHYDALAAAAQYWGYVRG